MSIKVISPGILSTIQDNGRYGYQKFGFSPSGVMDTRSYNIANLLVGNLSNEAVIEMTMSGGKFFTDEDVYIAITGADMSPKIDNQPVMMYKTLLMKKDSSLTFSKAISGMRTYVAFMGGIETECEMGSRSTSLKFNLGGMNGRKLMSGDSLEISRQQINPRINIHKALKEDFSSHNKTLRVVMGPQDDYFTNNGINTFLESEYVVTTNSDRMGYKLDGPIIESKDKTDIISDGIVFGSVQVPSGGKPIVMLADRQTTGGYAKIATVISVDLPLLVQSTPGDIIHFTAVSRTQAEKLYKEQNKQYEKMLLNY